MREGDLPKPVSAIYETYIDLPLIYTQVSEGYMLATIYKTVLCALSNAAYLLSQLSEQRLGPLGHLNL